MTQGFPAQPQQPQYAPQFQQPPAQPQYQQGMGAAPGGFFQTQDPYVQAQQGPAAPLAPQPGATQQADTSGFWGGAASISFDDRKGYVKGTPRGGQIISKNISNQTKMGTGEVLTWNDGSPRKQMVLLLQTAERADPQDNGQRQLFIKGDLPRAVREAFQAVSASDVEIGGWIYAAWVDEKPAKQAGYNPQKIFKAIYAPPGTPDPMAGQPSYTPPQPAMTPQNQNPAVPAQGGFQANGPMGVMTPPQQPAPGPIANAPAAAMANFQQQAQADPAVQAAVYGQPQQPAMAAADQQAQFAAWQAQQAAQGQQPGGQPNQAPPPQQPTPASPQPPGQGAQWSPFG